MPSRVMYFVMEREQFLGIAKRAELLRTRIREFSRCVRKSPTTRESKGPSLSERLGLRKPQIVQPSAPSRPRSCSPSSRRLT